MLKFIFSPEYAARQLGKWRGLVLLLYSILLFLVVFLAIFVAAPASAGSGGYIVVTVSAALLCVVFLLRGLHMLYRDLLFKDYATLAWRARRRHR